MKNKLTALKLPTVKITKTALLVTAAVLLLAVVFTYGAVRHNQAVRNEAAQSRLVAFKQSHDKQAADATIASLEASLKAETANKVAVCNYVSSLAAQKALVKLVSVPAACK